ncbi:MAG: GNAT family N-acetyltransferase [Gallionellaceae bacterium]|nr:GNAT family N-acetyltransferase [Gallionellaceae bacterium]
MPSAPTLRIFESIKEIPRQPWNELAGSNPFLKHEFLSALQDSGCAVSETGWEARFLTLWQEEVLVAGMPLYLKYHSWGDFVFDHAWAQAYERAGLRYYPKLQSSVPFTPATGNRLFAATPELRAALLQAAIRFAQELGVSSLHILFPPEAQAKEIQTQGMMLRQGTQFHWRNTGFADFNAYLASMSHDKRKRIKQERRKVKEAGITFERLTGKQITDEHWLHYQRCYENTHQQYRSPQALNLDFFRRVSASMSENILLVIALRDGQPIAGALNFYHQEALFGRSWGALEFHSGLHFEACYYQAIEFCFEHNIPLFEGGAQGEHKLSRGFLPETTWSAHWIADPRFANAVEDFLQRESRGVAMYIDELNEHSPFKQQADI